MYCPYNKKREKNVWGNKKGTVLSIRFVIHHVKNKILKLQLELLFYTFRSPAKSYIIDAKIIFYLQLVVYLY